MGTSTEEKQKGTQGVQATESKERDRKYSLSLKQVGEMAKDANLLNGFAKAAVMMPDEKAPVIWAMAKALAKQTTLELK